MAAIVFRSLSEILSHEAPLVDQAAKEIEGIVRAGTPASTTIGHN